MSKHLPYPAEEHRVRLACLDPAALAYQWIVQFAESLSRDGSDEYDDYAVTYTADQLIDIGMNVLEGNFDYISGGSELDGTFDYTFWDKLAVLKNIEIPEEKRDNFFSCSC